MDDERWTTMDTTVIVVGGGGGRQAMTVNSEQGSLQYMMETWR
jgi:peptidase E